MEITVASKTIGTEAWYKMSTVDISKSGLLLSWDRNTKMPFIRNTIIEITIDPSSSVLKTPVTCLAKVVRRDEAMEPRPDNVRGDFGAEVGVQIVQMDNDDLGAWVSCLSELEKRFEHLQIPDRFVPEAA
jgi:hypothetical protein